MMKESAFEESTSNIFFRINLYYIYHNENVNKLKLFLLFIMHLCRRLINFVLTFLNSLYFWPFGRENLETLNFLSNSS